jgi:hypothetical protein
MSEELNVVKTIWCAAFGAAFADRVLRAAQRLHTPGTPHRVAVEAALRRTTGAAKMAKAVADAETGPRTDGARSALVRCDLILRSDGTAVALDGCMGFDSMALLRDARAVPLPQWDEFVKRVQELPDGCQP